MTRGGKWAMHLSSTTGKLTAGIALLTASWQVQATNFADPSFVRAAVVVATYDALSAACQRQGGLSPADASHAAEWERSNGADAVRARLNRLASDLVSRSKVAELRQAVDAKLQSMEPERQCSALMNTVALPEAQLRQRFPKLIAELSQPMRIGATAPAGGSATKAINPSQLAAQIDSFGFDSRTTMGVGGSFAATPYPIGLFRDGRALEDVRGLSYRGGLAAHQRAHPQAWSRWRRSGNEVQVQSDTGNWRSLAFRTTYAALPAGYRLEGVYRAMRGAGNVSTGGADAGSALRTYVFGRDGRIIRDAGAGAFASFGATATAAASVAPSQRGWYRIDRLTLHIDYDDGSAEARIILTDPRDPKGAVWLDGIGYARKE
jgi:hypothetical protein